jgi:hypothetical protein
VSDREIHTRTATDRTEQAENGREPTWRDVLADTFAVWPWLAVSVQLMPWHWQLDLYRDPIERAGHVVVGPFRVEWGVNTPAFPIERGEQP